MATSVWPVAAGIGFTEGPLWTDDGRLLVASVSRGLIYEVDWRAGTADSVCAPGGRPSGLAQDASGDVWIVQMDRRFPGIHKMVGGQAVPVAAAGVDSPVDCVVSADGRLWFTDCVGDPTEPDSVIGHLRTLDIATESVTTIAGGLKFPNGVVFDPTGRWLYISTTSAGEVLRLDTTADSSPQRWFSLPSGRPDGLAVDRDGNVYVAATTAEAILVVSPQGHVVETVHLGDGALPTSVCFGGPDLSTLFITVPSGGRVLATERVVPGLPSGPG